jgi:hypothetical protein
MRTSSELVRREPLTRTVKVLWDVKIDGFGDEFKCERAAEGSKRDSSLRRLRSE